MAALCVPDVSAWFHFSQDFLFPATWMTLRARGSIHAMLVKRIANRGRVMRGERKKKKKKREQRRRTATRNLKKKVSEAEVAFFFFIIRSIIAWVVVFPPMINRDYR